MLAKQRGHEERKLYPLPLLVESQVEDGSSYIIYHKTLRPSVFRCAYDRRYEAVMNLMPIER
jgi:hypothetical protein